MHFIFLEKRYTTKHMTVQEQIKNAMKEAMKARDMGAVTTYRGIMSAFTNEIVAQKKSPDTPISDEDAIRVLTREAKKRKDAIQQYEDAGRPELAEDEKKELALIEQFLPELMKREEIEEVVKAKIEALGIQDASEKGKLMGAIMGELKGKADGTLVKEVVESLLS